MFTTIIPSINTSSVHYIFQAQFPYNKKFIFLIFEYECLYNLPFSSELLASSVYDILSIPTWNYIFFSSFFCLFMRQLSTKSMKAQQQYVLDSTWIKWNQNSFFYWSRTYNNLMWQTILNGWSIYLRSSLTSPLNDISDRIAEVWAVI